jgi:hypothetical protein
MYRCAANTSLNILLTSEPQIPVKSYVREGAIYIDQILASFLHFDENLVVRNCLTIVRDSEIST